VSLAHYLRDTIARPHQAGVSFPVVWRKEEIEYALGIRSVPDEMLNAIDPNGRDL
jgi:hypothetical protein